MPNPSENQTSGRSSPRLQSSTPLANQAQLASVLQDLSKKIDKLVDDRKLSNEKMDKLVEKNEEVLQRLDSNSTAIDELKSENNRLNDEVKLLNEKVMKQDQYSRKDILIMTGLQFEEHESPEELATTVSSMLNKITGKKLALNARDFVAIHRNGRSYRNSRPPTVTVKFIRFSDKDLVFSKLSMSNCKNMYPGIHVHHGLCPGYVDIRNQLSQINNVKFVRYAGANRYFTVCVTDPTGGNDIFFNRIENVKQLKSEMEK